MVKLHVILAQSEGDPEIDLVAGEVVARETFSILTTTAVIRPNTTNNNLFLGRTNPQHADQCCHSKKIENPRLGNKKNKKNPRSNFYTFSENFWTKSYFF